DVRVLAATPRAQQELERHGCRELGRAAKATASRIERGAQATNRAIQLVALRVSAARRKRELLAQVSREQPGLGSHLVASRPVGVGDPREDARESRQPVPVIWREVGPAVERL